MAGRHQPLNGADSAEALADVWPDDLPDFWSELPVPHCAACSLPAVTDGLCAGHARLGEYRVTDENHWAANE